MYADMCKLKMIQSAIMLYKGCIDDAKSLIVVSRSDFSFYNKHCYVILSVEKLL